MKYILGIDFGTTTTAISCTKIGASFEPELMEIDNHRTTESVVRLSEGNEVELVGIKAWESIAEAPERTFSEFKLNVASKDKLLLPAGEATARDVGVIFLRCLREKIERSTFGNSPLSEIDENEGISTVIGHPSGWNEIQRKATISMAEEAGFPHVVGCEEPIAALYYHYYLGDLSFDKAQKVLIYDFGGGTSDVAIVETSEGSDPKIISTAGISNLGGRNFDEKVAAAWEKKLLAETEKKNLSPSDVSVVRKQARKLKEGLSIAVENNKNSAKESIPMLQCKMSSDSFELSSPVFEEISNDLISRFAEPIFDALSSASLVPEDIDIVLLTGGSARFYFSQRKIKEMFPKAKISRSVNPQETVTKGLALYSKALKNGLESIKRRETSQDVEFTRTTRTQRDPYKARDDKKKSGVGKYAVAALVVLSVIGWMFYNGSFNPAEPPKPATPPISSSRVVPDDRLKRKDEFLYVINSLSSSDRIAIGKFLGLSQKTTPTFQEIYDQLADKYSNVWGLTVSKTVGRDITYPEILKAVSSYLNIPQAEKTISDFEKAIVKTHTNIDFDELLKDRAKFKTEIDSYKASSAWFMADNKALANFVTAFAIMRRQ